MAFKAQTRTWYLQLYRLPPGPGLGDRKDWVKIPGYALRMHDTTLELHHRRMIAVDETHEFEACSEPDLQVTYERELHMSYMEHSTGQRVAIKEGPRLTVGMPYNVLSAHIKNTGFEGDTAT